MKELVHIRYRLASPMTVDIAKLQSTCIAWQQRLGPYNIGVQNAVNRQAARFVLASLRAAYPLNSR